MSFRHRRRQIRDWRKQLRHFFDWPRYDTLVEAHPEILERPPEWHARGNLGLGVDGSFFPQVILRQPILEVHRERKNRPGQRKAVGSQRELSEESSSRYSQVELIAPDGWNLLLSISFILRAATLFASRPRISIPNTNNTHAERQKWSWQLTTASQRTAFTPIRGDVRSCDDQNFSARAGNDCSITQKGRKEAVP